MTADAENNQVHAKVKYTSPDSQEGKHPRIYTVNESDVLKIGRDPDPVGLGVQLVPPHTAKAVSAVALEISITEDGVKLKNTNRKARLAYGGDGVENGWLKARTEDRHPAGIEIPGNGWAHIPADGGGVHLIEFELLNHEPPPVRPSGGSSTTVANDVFQRLSRGYQETCAALIANTRFNLRGCKRTVEPSDSFIASLKTKGTEETRSKTGSTEVLHLKDKILELYDEIAPDEYHGMEKLITPQRPHLEHPHGINARKGGGITNLIVWIQEASEFTDDQIRDLLHPGIDQWLED